MDLGISALNYVSGIKNNEFTVEEFISKSLERINEVDKNLHAFLQIILNGLTKPDPIHFIGDRPDLCMVGGLGP